MAQQADFVRNRLFLLLSSSLSFSTAYISTAYIMKDHFHPTNENGPFDFLRLNPGLLLINIQCKNTRVVLRSLRLVEFEEHLSIWQFTQDFQFALRC